MKRELFDYHTQARSHGKNEPVRIEETIEAAIRCGLNAICLTDHFPLPKDFIDPTRDRRVVYPEYAEKVLAAQKKYQNKIEVLLGAEFDWLPEYQDLIKRKIDTYPFDYIIGSVHVLCKKDKVKQQVNTPIDYEKEDFIKGVLYYGGMKNFIRAYYAEIQKLIQSRLFDGLGHIDRIKVFNDGSLFSENEEWYRKAVLETLDILSQSKMVLEINTSGFYRNCKAQYPSFWILKEAQKRNIEITTGSDAHKPQDVGRDLEKAIELAKQAGYKKLIKFQKRKKVEVLI